MCTCVFALRNLIIVIDDGLDFVFTARILYRKYLNDEGGKREVNTRIQERDAICLFQTASEREKTHTIYTKLYQTEREKKSGYFDKNLPELVKESKKKKKERTFEEEREREGKISTFFFLLRLAVYIRFEVTIIPSKQRKR